MRELNEEVSLTLTMFCEEHHPHTSHPWSEIGTVFCSGNDIEEDTEPDK